MRVSVSFSSEMKLTSLHLRNKTGIGYSVRDNIPGCRLLEDIGQGIYGVSTYVIQEIDNVTRYSYPKQHFSL